ncbi:MAG: phosphoglycerate kinase [Phycisphaerae bacterium]
MHFGFREVAWASGPRVARAIADVDVKGKTVLMRVDFNVPVKGGKVTNDRRIRQALPSIERLLKGGAKLVLMSHLGRPDGRFEADGSLAPVAQRLQELLKTTVKLGPAEVVGAKADQLAKGLAPGGILLLENVRFNPGETMPDKAKKNPDKKLTPEQQKVHDDFVAAIAKLGDVYVNDAFGTCHRKHASMYGVAKAIQAKGGPAVAGFLVEKEIKYFKDMLANPARPYVAVMGGAKISDKLKLISSLLAKVDKILIGGAMAYTLLKARGVSVGRSLVEAEQVEEMKKLLASAGDKIVLPVDHVATDSFDFKAMTAGKPVPTADVSIPDNMMGMDIGPRTVAEYGKVIASARTIVWNGPMGVFEIPDYSKGTRAIAEALAAATGKGAITVIGGGDSAAAVEEMGLESKMSHISTGGGASIECLEGKPMPPLEVLDQK